MQPRAASGASLEELAKGSPSRLLFKYSWPALVSMSLNALYAVVDRAFIGKLCGTDAMAGLTLAMPLLMLFGAFGVLVGAGHSAVLSIKLGEKDRVACEKLLGELVALKLAIFFALPALAWLNLDAILDWSGAARVTPAAREAAATYLKLVLFSHLFSHLAFGLSAMQRAEGAAVKSMVCMVAGFGANLVLDPLFIYVFGLGIAGAAWATNIAMFASCTVALGYYLRGGTAVRLRLRRIGIYPRLATRALGIGFAPFLQQLMGALIAVSLQIAFAKWMPDEASRTAQIASLGVFQSALILVILPILGAQQGLQPIIGYNWGARNHARVLDALKTGLWATGALTFAAFVVQAVPPFPELVARLFLPSDDPSLISLAAHDLQLSNCMIWCIAVNIVATTYFQSIGRPKAAIFLSFLRQGLCLLPIIWILPHFMQDKAFAIWLSMPVSDVLCNAATLPPLFKHMRFLSRVRVRRAAVAAAVLAAASAARAEAWYVPGWMRAREPEGGAWNSFTNVYRNAECRFSAWDGNRIWPNAVANADAEADRLADEIAAMPESRRRSLSLVGHSLGGRIVARVLARLGRRGLSVSQGVLLAPAIPACDPDVAAMGAGSVEPAIVVANPKDVTLKYVYAVAGGESGPSLGTDGTAAPVANVVEFSCPDDITSTTEIEDLWGRTEAVKRIANHHASFYFAELGRILDGHPSPETRVMVPQGKVNVEWKVMDAGVWWDVLDEAGGWKLERHILTGHCRILDPRKKRMAWGREEKMRESFEKVKRQLARGGEADGKMVQ